MKNLISISLILFVSCNGQYKSQPKQPQQPEIPKIEFEDVGYYKSDAKYRVYTYWVSDTAWADIQEHGGRVMHSSGKITASFYYTDKSKVVDPTMARSYDNALDRLLNSGSIAAVFHGPSNGAVFMSRNTEKNYEY